MGRAVSSGNAALTVTLSTDIALYGILVLNVSV